MTRSSRSNKGRAFLFSLTLLVFAAVAAMAQLNFPYYIYHGFRSPDNHFIPSGWMGDYKDIRFDDHWKPADSKDAKTQVHIVYTAEGTQNNGWAGIYWQSPPNNWGDRPGGINLNGAKQLVFKVRGGKGGEIVDEFKVGGITGDYADSGSASIGPITLTREWKEYAIKLDGQELSSIAGGFCWVMSRENNPQGADFFLDDVRFE